MPKAVDRELGGSCGEHAILPENISIYGLKPLLWYGSSLARRSRTGRILRRWRDIDVAQENIWGAAVHPRRRLDPTLIAGSLFLVVAGALEHAKLPTC